MRSFLIMNYPKETVRPARSRRRSPVYRRGGAVLEPTTATTSPKRADRFTRSPADALDYTVFDGNMGTSDDLREMRSERRD
jgi:hypothetical protein